MTNTITVYIDSDASSLGPDATQDDLDGYAENLAAHLAEQFPGRDFDIEQIPGGQRAGSACPEDDEIANYVHDLHAGDGWVDLLPE